MVISVTYYFYIRECRLYDLARLSNWKRKIRVSYDTFIFSFAINHNCTLIHVTHVTNRKTKIKCRTTLSFSISMAVKRIKLHKLNMRNENEKFCTTLFHSISFTLCNCTALQYEYFVDLPRNASKDNKIKLFDTGVI